MQMKPEIGEWYQQPGGDIFEVVAIDDDDGVIEIQYFDGTVEEMDIEDWDAMVEDKTLEKAEPPEDWTGTPDGSVLADGDDVAIADDDGDEL